MKSSNFVTVIRGEAKNILSKKKLAALALLLIFVFFIISGAVSDIKELHKNSMTFKKLETDRFKFLRTYTAYSMLGSRYIFTPSLLSFLGMSNSYENLAARLDIVALDVIKNIKEGGIFSDDSSSPFNLTFLVMLFGTVICMFYGTGLPQRIPLYKETVIDVTGRKLFHMVQLARGLLILLIMFILILSILILLFCHGVHISSASIGILTGYALAAFIMLYMTFLVGVILGQCRNKSIILTLVLVISFLMTYFLPGLLRSYIARKESRINSSYIIEEEQYSVLRDFEDKSVAKYGKFSSDKLDLAKTIMNGYYENDYKKIEALEDSFYNEVGKLVKLNSLLSLFSPHTFFQLTADDVSSMGHKTFLKFYDMLKVEKRRFLRFYIDQTTKERPLILIPFETQHVFYAKGSLPELFWYGVLFNLALIAVLYLWANRLNENTYYRLDKIKMDTKEVEIRLKSGRLNLMLCYFPGFLRLFLSVVHGKKRYFKGKVFMDDKPLDLSKNNIFYLIGQAEMPGEVLLGDFLNAYQRFMKMSNDSYAGFLASVDNSLLNKKIRDISPSQRTDILLSLAENCGKKIIVFLMFLEGVPREKEHPHTNRIKALKAAGKTVCYFSGSSNDVIEGDVYYNIAPGEGQYGAVIVA